jgi:hypothetical protein
LKESIKEEIIERFEKDKRKQFSELGVEIWVDIFQQNGQKKIKDN